MTEAAFEEHIASWLVEHGGYRRAKIGNERNALEQIFWLRTPTSTIAINGPQEQDRIVARRWGA